MPSERAVNPLPGIYERLLQAYGPQGWWPLLDYDGDQPTKSGSMKGYHPGLYGFPRNEVERFEMCVGAILTQNTAWPNAERALVQLRQEGLLSPESLLAAPESLVETTVRPSGCFRAKSRKLRAMAQFFQALNGATPRREALLSVWGIGPETADSMLLYAYRRPEAVVDAYTTRILESLGWLPRGSAYADVKAWCADRLPPDVTVLQEFHALMVEHAKRFYRRPPYCDALLAEFRRGSSG